MSTVHVSDESKTEDIEVDHLIRRTKVDPPQFSLGAESFLAPPSSGSGPFTALWSSGAVPVGVILEIPRASIEEGTRIPSPIPEKMGDYNQPVTGKPGIHR